MHSLEFRHSGVKLGQVFMKHYHRIMFMLLFLKILHFILRTNVSEKLGSYKSSHLEK